MLNDYEKDLIVKTAYEQAYKEAGWKNKVVAGITPFVVGSGTATGAAVNSIGALHAHLHNTQAQEHLLKEQQISSEVQEHAKKAIKERKKYNMYNAFDMRKEYPAKDDIRDRRDKVTDDYPNMNKRYANMYFYRIMDNWMNKEK